MAWIPVSDPLPPDDFHTWARPAPPECPDCGCCSERLCRKAIEDNSACHWLGRSEDFELSKCPCWRPDSPARVRLAAETSEGIPSHLRDLLDEPATVYAVDDPNAPKGGA